MLFFSGVKVNLGLRVLRKRPDGYHDLETIMVPVPWQECIEVLPDHTENRFEIFGAEIPGPKEKNLIWRAYQLLSQTYQLPPTYLAIRKTLPIGAGLGGGSANAATTLKALNQVYGLALSESQLVHYAAQLGSDCAFFIANRPALATGRGEVLTPVPSIGWQGYITIVFPGEGVSTAEAYAGIKPEDTAGVLLALYQQGPENWKASLVNDFEPSVFTKRPVIAMVKDRLYAMGATYASMSGSGASVYGLFDHEADVRYLEAAGYQVFVSSITL